MALSEDDDTHEAYEWYVVTKEQNVPEKPRAAERANYARRRCASGGLNLQSL